MSDFYADILSLVQPELDIQAQLQVIAKRRGLEMSDVIREAMEDFLEKDFINPKSPETDYKLMFPAGEDKALDGYDMPIRTPLSLPCPYTCPDELIEQWISLVELDLSLLHGEVSKFDATTDPVLRKQFERVMLQYALVRERLNTRKGARDAYRSQSAR